MTACVFSGTWDIAIFFDQGNKYPFHDPEAGGSSTRSGKSTILRHKAGAMLLKAYDVDMFEGMRAVTG